MGEEAQQKRIRDEYQGGSETYKIYFGNNGVLGTRRKFGRKYGELTDETDGEAQLKRDYGAIAVWLTYEHRANASSHWLDTLKQISL